MSFQIIDDNGHALDAHFDMEGADVILHSRGGGQNGRNGINLDYSRALRLMLHRLAASSLRIEGSWVDSSRVQGMGMEERRILFESEAGEHSAEVFTLLSKRMKGIGRDRQAKGYGNSTKRIRMRITGATAPDEILQVLGGRAAHRDFRSLDRLPVSELEKVDPLQLWNAAQRLLRNEPHAFGESTDFDLIVDDGRRLPPKAVFGLAATEALGFEVLPRHFSGGEGTPCFRLLRAAGYSIVPKGEHPIQSGGGPEADQEWTEGALELVTHLRRERAAGLAAAKRAAFAKEHGSLHCEKCRMDPVAVYGAPHGEACIEVHHSAVAVETMSEGHVTRLSDLECLCANCHRVAHRLMRLKKPWAAPSFRTQLPLR